MLSVKRNCFSVLHIHTTYQEESQKFEQCLIVSLLQSFPPCMAADTVSFTPSTVADNCLVRSCTSPQHNNVLTVDLQAAQTEFTPNVHRSCRPLELTLH